MSNHTDYHYAETAGVSSVCRGTATLPESWDPAAKYVTEAARLLSKAKVLAVFGVDDFEEGAVITWTRTFDRDMTSTRTNRAYTYVALKAGGRWWITGLRGERGIRYGELVEDWLCLADADTINIVAKWAVFE